MTDAQWWRTIIIRTVTIVVAVGVGGATGVALVDLTAQEAAERVCARMGCDVPAPARSALTDGPAAEYVSLCEDSPDGAGPCVILDDLNGVNVWWYVAPGAHYPGNRVRIGVCTVETGGPVPCVWVPSMMGEHRNTGDSGAYVYR